ncbi:MAG: TolC family protein [Hyphomonas sp.]|nr:TolC family protein [Hyphomonas sp.]
MLKAFGIPGRWHATRHGAVLCSLCALLAGCSNLSPPVAEPQLELYTGSISQELLDSSPPVTGTLNAAEAVRRAIAYNQEVQAVRFAAAIEDAKTRVERGQLLPDVIAQSDYYRLSKRPFSRSNRSNEYSTSRDLATLTRSIELSYNLLDFGLTLIRMRQAGDKANQKHEEVRRVALQIVEETRGAYWRAVALQTLLPEIGKVTPHVNEALRLSGLAMQDVAIDPVHFINFQRDLLNTRRELNDVYAELAGAEHHLRNLANIMTPGELVLDARKNETGITLPHRTGAEDVALALSLRPEMRQNFYDARITEQEVHATILQMLPGATLTQTLTSDSNSYLLHGNWIGWSARIATNLIEIVRLPEKLDAVDAQQEANTRNAMVAAAAIAMQVHVARARLVVEHAVYRDAEDYARNQAVLLQQVKNSVLAGKLPEQMVAREQLSALLAQIRAIVAYGELEAAFAAYNSALGMAPSEEVAALNE